MSNPKERLRAEMQAWAEKNNPAPKDWKRYYLFYDEDAEKVDYDLCAGSYKDMNVYFTAESTAREALEIFGKEFESIFGHVTTPDVKEIPLERVFQKKIKDYLSTIPGCCVWKVNQGAYSSAGIPDIHCVINGKFFAFEVKRPWIGKETKLQREMVEKINNAGGRAEFVSFVYEVKEVLESEGVICG